MYVHASCLCAYMCSVTGWFLSLTCRHTFTSNCFHTCIFCPRDTHMHTYMHAFGLCGPLAGSSPNARLTHMNPCIRAHGSRQIMHFVNCLYLILSTYVHIRIYIYIYIYIYIHTHTHTYAMPLATIPLFE